MRLNSSMIQFKAKGAGALEGMRRGRCRSGMKHTDSGKVVHIEQIRQPAVRKSIWERPAAPSMAALVSELGNTA